MSRFKGLSKLFGGGKKSFQKPHTLMSAENPYHEATTQMSNEELMKLLQGYDMDVIPTKGKYGAEEGSLMIKDPTPEQQEFLEMTGKTLGQDSVIHSTGKEHQMKYLQGDKAGQYTPGKGTEIYDDLPEDFYTETPEGDIFTHQFDFDQVVNPADERKRKMTQALGLGTAAGAMLAPEDAEGAGIQTLMKKLGISEGKARAIKESAHLPRRQAVDKRIEAMERVREHLKSPAPPLINPSTGKQVSGAERKIFELDDERLLKETSPIMEMFNPRTFESGISAGALNELGLGPETITINLPKDYKSKSIGDIPKQYQIQERVPYDMKDAVPDTEDRINEISAIESLMDDRLEGTGLSSRDVHDANVRYNEAYEPQIIDTGLYGIKPGEIDKDLFEKAMDTVSATPEEKALYRRYAYGDEAFIDEYDFDDARRIAKNMELRGRPVNPELSNTQPGSLQGDKTNTFDRLVQEQIDAVNKPKSTGGELSLDSLVQEQINLGKTPKAGLTSSHSQLTPGSMLGRAGSDLFRAYEDVNRPVVEATKKYVTDPITEQMSLSEAIPASMPEARERQKEFEGDVSQFAAENIGDVTNLIPGAGTVKNVGKMGMAGARGAKRFGGLMSKKGKSAAEMLQDAKSSPFGRTAVVDTEAPIGKVQSMPSRAEDDEVIKLLEMLNLDKDRGF